MRVGVGTASLLLCIVVFVAALATAACEASNSQRGGEMYEKEAQRIQMEGRILHLLNSVETLEMEQLAIESPFGDPQTPER
ncbi:MAG TPA: hypothetical protein EYQ74_02040 [Planctomycetes bacterium]|nr:hypothetical protein [Planctomycetota bacterium]HIK61443.1 hypothetical protein [Planctomycetota bacterium]